MATNKSQQSPKVKAGSFSLSNDVNLLSYATSGEGLETLNVRQLVSALTIYESFDIKFLSGDIQLTDNQGVIEGLPLTGHELIEFVLHTPGAEEMPYDFSRATGHPMHVYKISDISQLNQTTKTYKLHFCSTELIKNYTEVVDTAKKGTIDKIVVDIIKNNLKTKKDIFVEPTIGNRKYVFPRMKPLQAITMLAKESESKKFANTGYRFYETRYGLNFRSLESLFSNSDKTPKKAKAGFYDAPKGKQGDFAKNYQKVFSMMITSRFDTLHNLRNGVYASKMVNIDGLTKTFSESNYSFQEDFNKLTHVGLSDSQTGKPKGNKFSFLPAYNYNEGKTLSGFPEANVYFNSSSTSGFTEKGDDSYKVKNPYDRVPVEKLLQRQKGQQYAFEQNIIEISVPGNISLCLGDVVGFSTIIQLTDGGVKRLVNDPFLTGNYLISSIAHVMSVVDGAMRTNLTLMKDCISAPYPTETKNRKEGSRKERIIDVYSVESKEDNFSIRSWFS